MCGIVGILSRENIVSDLIEGLKRLEYRGYDSSGVATLNDGQVVRARSEGKIKNLEDVLDKSPITGNIGIAHTRWATHGAPVTKNAHPHATEKVAIVHNGIIENFLDLKKSLELKGHKFCTETDSEVIAHLLTEYIDQGHSPIEALKLTVDHLEGAYALAILVHNEPETLYCARKGSPLVIGIGNESMYIGSDALALAPFTSRLIYLEDGDYGKISFNEVALFDINHESVTRPEVTSHLTGASIGKENYRHFMQKEIYEQPTVVGTTLQRYIRFENKSLEFNELDIDFTDVPRITLVSCGSAYIASLVAKYWLETVARISVEVDIASEFRYREAPLPKNGVCVFVSQSGETADTLAALRYAKEQEQYCIAIVNSLESTIARESHIIIPTLAGPEICVASTKAFVTQLTVLISLTLHIAQNRNIMSETKFSDLLRGLKELPSLISESFQLEDDIHELAKYISDYNHVLFLSRGFNYPIAMEGALKLKEISYIHAEAYAAGEIKHGPIALVDETMPLIFLAPFDKWFPKTLSNVQEVMARGGQVIVFTDIDGQREFKKLGLDVFVLPKTDTLLTPILYTIPVQLLAYHTAVIKGTDVDQPRNLAKSVTVE